MLWPNNGLRSYCWEVVYVFAVWGPLGSQLPSLCTCLWQLGEGRLVCYVTLTWRIAATRGSWVFPI